MGFALPRGCCRAGSLSVILLILCHRFSSALDAATDTAGTTFHPVSRVGTTYTEDLSLQRLGVHHVAAMFVFRSEWVPQARHRCQSHENWGGREGKGIDEGGGKLCHFEASFPRAVGVLLDRFKVRDLRLQMSKGKWDTTAWGNGPRDGAGGEYTSGGAEMWARLPSGNVWETWVGLRRSLSGLYCSSLDAMDETRVHTPTVMTMPGESARTYNGTTILRGTLPREPVCTENLIPLIKMLPCRSKTGLGRLLHPTRLFQADYHSISVRASANFSSNSSDSRQDLSSDDLDQGAASAAAVGRESITSLTLEQRVLAVFRPRPHLPAAVKTAPTIKRPTSTSATSPGKTADFEVSGGEQGWSISSLLLPPKASKGAQDEGASPVLDGCPVASRSAIHILDGVAGRGTDVLTNTGASKSCANPEESCDAQQLDAIEVEGASVGINAQNGYESIKTHLFSSTGSTTTDSTTTRESSSVADFMREELWDEASRSEESVGYNDNNKVEAATGPAIRSTVDSPSAGAAAVSSATPAVARLDHFLSGRGGTRGVSVAHLVNMHPSDDAYVDFLQPVPYFMVPLVGTMRARLVPSYSQSSLNGLPYQSLSVIGEVNETRTVHGYDGLYTGDSGNSEQARPPIGPVLSLAKNITFTPGVDHKPAVIEARLWVPAASTLVLGFDFFKRFLTVDEFPPDPSRGFDVPAPFARFSFAQRARVSFEDGVEECTAADGGASTTCDASEDTASRKKQRRERVVYVYGEAGLLDSPQPDFSMPFNVITFTSTVITFFLGTAINLLVRKSAPAARRKKKRRRGDGKSEGDDSGSDVGVRGWLAIRRRALRKAFGFLRRRNAAENPGRNGGHRSSDRLRN